MTVTMDSNYNNGLVDSSSYVIFGNNIVDRDDDYVTVTTDLLSSHSLGVNKQVKTSEEISVQVSRPSSVLRKNGATIRTQAMDVKIATPYTTLEPYCNVKLTSIIKLKDSTKRLLCLLDEIQTKTNAKDFPPPNDEVIEPTPITDDVNVSTSEETDPALQKLESQTKNLNTIYIENEDDDCSIFKRLTRKCNCLNQQEYNDFVIHFNEDTKYFTSTIGEIIKNMRILKKFLYMGGKYTKNALAFLNEGLADSAYAERIEITQGCAHSDICNVFEDNSIVTTCISWPCKLEYYGDTETQNYAASFLYKLAQIEEGRRYLKFTSRITNDIKKLLKKKGSKLEPETTDTLNAALDLMHPPMTQNVKNFPLNDEGFENETIKALKQYRMYMTLHEVFTHLEFLHTLSSGEKGKIDLTSYLPDLLLLFKDMLREYNNSKMNIIITNILNNIVSKNMLKQQESELLQKTVAAVETSTEAIKMKSEIIQMPPPPSPQKKHTKKRYKSKIHVGAGQNKFRQASRRKVSEFDNPVLVNRSKKFSKERRPNVIVVPIEKNIKSMH